MTPPSRRQPPVLAIAIGALLVVVALGVVLALTGGDDGGDNAALSRAYGPVEVTGEPLPTFTGTEDDPAVGQVAPELEGVGLDGSAVTVGAGQPTVVAFLAHWCPHCQAELPRLVEVADDGGFDGVRTVAVLTGTNADAPNYPPGAWLDHEGWRGDVLLDDEQVTAARAYGLAGYPFLVALDRDGRVVARTSGELAREDVEALAALARDGDRAQSSG